MKNTNLYRIISSPGILKSILMVAAFWLGFTAIAYGQGFNEKYNVYLFGQITNDVNGAPIQDQKVFIVSDTLYEPNFTYTNIVYTDHEGYFYDTILTTLEKGTLKVHTYDYQDLKHDTTTHYRFMWSESNILFANFILPTPPLINVNQANFTYIRDPNGTNPQEYEFHDLTDSEDIIGWEWDFGDGFSSEEQNPSHTYEDGGVYKVIFTVSIFSTQNSKPYITKIVKIINVADELYFHMGGHVFAGSFPIDKSEVFLYKIEGDDLIPIDTAIFNDSLGYYLFYQLIEGEYLVKADLHPTSELFNMFMTTYYSDKLHWDEADTIFHHATNYEYDVSLAPNTNAAYGPGIISGEIIYDPAYGGGKSSMPAENVSILLFDGTNQPANICHSDENGQFSLDELDLQMYYVYAEVTGKYTYPVEVLLEESSSGNINLQIIIDDTYVSGVVTPGVHENSLHNSMSEVFPNPVDHSFTLTYSGNSAGSILYSVLNYAGQVIQSSTLSALPGSPMSKIDVSELEKGVYFIRFTDNQNQSTTRKFIKK